MPALSRAAGTVAGRGRRAAAISALLTAAIVAAAMLAVPSPALAVAGAGSGCTVQQVGPGTWEWVCTNAGGTPGSPGSGGGRHTRYTCTLARLTRIQAEFLGLAWPPPKGHFWAAITCPGKQPFGGVVLVSTATGVPAITPRQLLQVAIGELRVPSLAVGTAPPAGKDGLVGLPEWFWVPAARWHPVSVTVTAGPVWATATATPGQLTFQPGPGLAGVSCQGPGTAYRPRLPASAQRSPCTYTYDQSSDGQPGNSYAAALTVTWRISWTGSGGAGGVVDSGYQVSDGFGQPVAEGQALVTSP